MSSITGREHDMYHMIDFEETELRLGLPGGKENDGETSKNNGKRRFSETVNLSEKMKEKSSTADPAKNSNAASAAAAFVKVSMDGAPYLRKVDLKLYNSYQELSDALSKMFSSFTIGN
ncbi:hypothetical protein V6N11_060100 [Hibiscus sabdariffa]|uniref:Uncharacterized protein n=2 Tax=Hibiscus sabdariffa TaxID=183260 RepID=A0ABR2C931_9ROSI